jgi:hypothetical protein
MAYRRENSTSWRKKEFGLYSTGNIETKTKIKCEQCSVRVGGSFYQSLPHKTAFLECVRRQRGKVGLADGDLLPLKATC